MEAKGIYQGKVGPDISSRYNRGVDSPMYTQANYGRPSFPLKTRRLTPNSEDGRLNLEIPDEIRNLDEFWQELEVQLGPKHADAPTQACRDLPGVVNTPTMNILMLIVGSRGDVQPFLALAIALKRYGHRIRIATHTCFRTLIEDHEIEYYDLGGDPKELMAYMVKNPALIPGLSAIRNGEIRARRSLMRNIINRCWHACFQTGTDESKREETKGQAGPTSTSRSPMPFVADSIIANPPSMGHIHCAEKLGIPLHIFFT